MEFWRRHNVATLTLDGFDKYCCHFLGWYSGAKQGLFQPVNTGCFAVRIAEMIGASVAITIWDVGDSRHERVVVFFLDGFTCSEG